MKDKHIEVFQREIIVLCLYDVLAGLEWYHSIDICY